MKSHALPHHGIPRADPHRAAAHRAVRYVMDRFLLLPAGAAIALVWANTAAEEYFRFSHALAFAVNDVAMAVFLALVAHEVVEAVMPGGALHSWRRWGLPVIAAAGGMLGAAAVYLLYVGLKHESVLVQGWPVACAIDVAAAYDVLKIVWRRSSALPFLLVLALSTDAVGLIVVALRAQAMTVRSGGVLLMLAALGLAAVLRFRKVRAFWPYLLFSGSLSWAALYLEGVHPALALVPIVPFLPREPRALDLFAGGAVDDPVHRSEHAWNELAQVVLFFFGLVNAGVILRGYDTGTWAMLAAAFVGRPLGILAATALAVALGFHLPRRVGWSGMAVIAMATSSGFTFALFFAAGLIPMGPVLAQIKLGALATVMAAGAAIATARVLRVGRFAR
jgi:NhaA family Na+:H+ antiporter